MINYTTGKTFANSENVTQNKAVLSKFMTQVTEEKKKRKKVDR